VEVTWEPPSVTNRTLNYYTVVYACSDDMVIMEVNSSDVTVFVSGLDPFTIYTFYVLTSSETTCSCINLTVLTDEAG